RADGNTCLSAIRSMNTTAYERASALYWQGEHAQAFASLLALAETGCAKAQVNVGWMYSEGIGTPRNIDAALMWYENAAKLESPEGMYYCGRLRTVLGKHDESIKWYEDAARLNYSPAIYRLGYACETGLGVPRDLERARVYYERASFMGHVFARRQLALLLMRGEFGALSMFRAPFLFMSALFNMVRKARKRPYADELKG